VEPAQGVVADLTGEGVVGPGGAEQLVQGGVVQRVRHGGPSVSAGGHRAVVMALPKAADSVGCCSDSRANPVRNELMSFSQRPATDDTTWVLTDGHAGNLRQAEALARALHCTTPHAPGLFPTAPWRWLAPRLLP